mgnify:CR=1 FL=1
MRGYRCCDLNRLRRCFGNGSRITFPRRVIIDFFHKNRGHFTADEVYSKISAHYPGIGIATVYRTLNILHEQGILDKFDFDDNKAKYELSQEHIGYKHHHHMICSNCGKVIEYNDFSDDEKKFIEHISENLKKKYGFTIKKHVLYFKGICASCNKNEKK